MGPFSDDFNRPGLAVVVDNGAEDVEALMPLARPEGHRAARDSDNFRKVVIPVPAADAD